VWREKSVAVLNRAALQRKALSEHRAAYWKYNEEVRRSQYSMQIQVRTSRGSLLPSVDLFFTVYHRLFVE
jgi:hypothetical protein